jgi:hypothetical protein
VKVTRSTVALTRVLTNVAGHGDWMLRLLFAQAARGLPLARLPELRRQRAPQLNPTDAVREPEHALRRSYGNSGS